MPKGVKPRRPKNKPTRKPEDIHLIEMVEVDMAEHVLDEEDENLVDMNFSMGNPISKGIPWKDYTELEIQALLKMHFELLDYETTWRHRDDPANEEGIDLEFYRKSDNRKVLVAVKKFPKKEALAQIVELADHEADERIYVYVGGGAQSFRNKQANFSSKVVFWDERELESMLNETGMTLRLKIANSKSDEAIFRIMVQIVRGIKGKPPQALPADLSNETLETLWGMKDRAVTVHRCASMAQSMLEKPTQFGELTQEQVQTLVMHLLDYLYTYGLMSLRRTFEDLSPELRSLLHEVHKKTEIRSNWLELLQYTRGAVPGTVAGVHEEFEKDRARWKEVVQRMKSRGSKEATEVHEPTHLEEAADSFRLLSIWAGGLEGTIDYLYERCVRGEVGE